MALINSPNRFQFNVLMNSSIGSFHVDIPNFFDNYSATKFLVTSVIGKMNTGISTCFIHSSALRNNGILYLADNSNDLIATTVLSEVVTNPININSKNNDIGFIFPHNLITGGVIDFTIKDHLGDLLNDLEYIVITIEVFQNS
jgi:hypothetical protein